LFLKQIAEQTVKGSENLKKHHDKKRTEKARLKNAVEKTGHLVPVGRRIILLGVFAEQMWCEMCDIPLSLRFMEEEIRPGLSSDLFVRCHQCLSEKTVRTDRDVVDPADASLRPLSAIHCKAALG